MMMITSSATLRHLQWLVPLIIHFGLLGDGTKNVALAMDNFEELDEVILTDILSSYVGYEESTCSGETHASTTFDFNYPGINTESGWNTNFANVESLMFLTRMNHTDINGNRSWDIRIGTNGNIYSHFTKDMVGEALPPQSLDDSPGVDDVIQMVSVNSELNGRTVQPQYCTGSDTGTCKKNFIHQAGVYSRDAGYTDVLPFFSPSLASHCVGNMCSFASWGQQAHVETPFTSTIIYINKYTNCGGGQIEHTQMIHNFADPSTPASIDVDYEFFNVGWGGTRSSHLPFALEADPQDNSLDFGHPNDMDYVPLCPWGDDVKDENAASVQAPKDISATAGYTTFVGEGLLIDHPISLPCSKTGGCNSANFRECMVDRCTDAQIDTEGYKRIELAIPPGGPSCAKHSLWEGYITLKCRLLSEAVFGQNRAHQTTADSCAPWLESSSKIGFKNTATGATLEVAFVRHWSWSPGNSNVYFTVFETDEATAVDKANNVFLSNAGTVPIPVEVVAVYDDSPPPVLPRPWCRIPEGCNSGNVATCMKPCDDIDTPDGHTQMPLEISAGGPNCVLHRNNDPFPRKVSISCNLHPVGYGNAIVGELKGIDLHNTLNGQTLQLDSVRLWSWKHTDRKMYIRLPIDDDGDPSMPTSGVITPARQRAIDLANSVLANGSGSPVPLELRYNNYKPHELPTFSYIYGKGQDYANTEGEGRRRIGSTRQGDGQRDFTVFTVNWWNGARLIPGDTYINRGFLLSSDLGSVKSTAEDLVEKTYIAKVAPQDYTPRSIDIYTTTNSAYFVGVPEGTLCSSQTQAACSGKSTPSAGHVPYYYVTCGASTYFGTNPYRFTPSFGSEFPDNGNITMPVRSYVCDGQDLSVRPTWKLLGFFNSSSCAEIEGAEYHEGACDNSLFTSAEAALAGLEDTNSPNVRLLTDTNGAESTTVESATYYMGYNTGGCSGRNELGIITTPVVEECAKACDDLPTCVSFEYQRGSTNCQLSSTCDKFTMTVNQPGNDHMWYLKVTNEVNPENVTPHAYLWLLNNLPAGSVSPPVGVTSTKYYIGYDTGGCAGRNELGMITKPVIEECAAACDALPNCVSFEYQRGSTNCQLSATCGHFGLTANDPENAYMWYKKADSYTSPSATGGNAYLWLISE